MKQRSSIAGLFDFFVLFAGVTVLSQRPDLRAEQRVEKKSVEPKSTAPGNIAKLGGKSAFTPDWLKEPLYGASDALVSWLTADGHALDLAGSLHGTKNQHVVFDKGCCGTAFSFPNGKGFVSVDSFPNLVDTFTMSMWVDPSATNRMGKEYAYKYAGVGGQRYAIYPSYGGRSGERAGSGISVGTNGVGVFEHTYDNSPCVLAHTAPIKGWTHLAVVYTNRTPTLYVNAAAVKTGTRSRWSVFPGTALGDRSGRGYGPYLGRIDELIHRVQRHAERRPGVGAA